VTDERAEADLDDLVGAGAPVWMSGRGGLQPARFRPWPAPAVSPGPAALIMASSGTTGPRKIIPLSEAQLLGTATAVARHHRLTPDDRGYCPLPLFHINGLVVGVLSTLVAGSTLVLDCRFSRSRFWAVAAAHDVTWLNLVPAIIARLAESPPPPAGVADGIRFARSASAPLAPGTLGRFEGRCGISVLETYGMTEAASQIAANPLDPRRRRPGSVGLGVGTEIRIVDETGHPVRHDTVGAVEIRGDQVVSRYWAATDRGLVDRPARRPGGWLSTGDLGRFDEDGFLYLVGRSDDVISAFKAPADITVAETLPAGPTGKVRRAEMRRQAARAATAPARHLHSVRL
jgi:acyl-CoA synthetase (AMP-forming)/AMP-acid ligase II